MSRKQQWVVLFLTLSMILFFFLTTPPARLKEHARMLGERDVPERKYPHGEFPVEVDGSVNRRGVYSIPAGLTILEVIEKAGGFSAKLSFAPESLLQQLDKSCRLNVLRGEGGKGMIQLEPLAPAKRKVLSLPIDINTASVEELNILPGVGPQIAQAIVEHREAYGKFASPEDLINVRGLGPKKLAAILPHLAVHGSP